MTTVLRSYAAFSKTTTSVAPSSSGNAAGADGGGELSVKARGNPVRVFAPSAAMPVTSARKLSIRSAEPKLGQHGLPLVPTSAPAIGAPFSVPVLGATPAGGRTIDQ